MFILCRAVEAQTTVMEEEDAGEESKGATPGMEVGPVQKEGDDQNGAPKEVAE